MDSEEALLNSTPSFAAAAAAADLEAAELGLGLGRYEQKVELVVVGAGPHALSLVTKLLEPRIDPLEEMPSNTTLFRRGGNDGRIRARFGHEPPAKLGSSKDTDLRRFEHASRAKANVKRRANIMKQCYVADPNGCWMAQWEQQFEALGIPFLRSSLTAHPDPLDVEMLRLFADEKKRRSTDAIEIELSRVDQYHGPYEVPSSSLFRDFHKRIVKRYDLKDSVNAASATRLVPVAPPAGHKSSKPWFEVHLDTGKCILAKNVVIATGGLGRANMPEWASTALDKFKHCPRAKDALLHSNDVIAKHSSSTSTSKPFGKRIQLLRSETRQLLIVGGGLTAGHLALQALRTNASVHVSIALRRGINVRQFDLELKWMGIKRDNNLAKFWDVHDMADRSKILKQCKNGGSMTPEVLSELRRFKACGRLTFLENTEPIDAQWNGAEWQVCFNTVQVRDDSERSYDSIWCATGTITDFRTDKLLQDIQLYSQSHQENIQLEGGRPVLTEDLRLSENLNVFMMGNYAALQIGPGALNLMGGKAAACRIVNAMSLSTTARDTSQGWKARHTNPVQNRRRRQGPGCSLFERQKC